MGVAVRITTPYFGEVPKTVMIVSTIPGPKKGLWFRRLNALYVAVGRLN